MEIKTFGALTVNQSSTTIEYRGETLHLRTRIGNRRQKTLRLIVKSDGEIVLSAPPRVSQATREAFVRERWDWLLAQQRRMRAQSPLKPQYHHGSEHILLGKLYHLHIEQQSRRGHELAANALIVRLPNPSAEQVAAQLNVFYREHAQDYFRQRLARLMPRAPWVVATPELRVRRMKRQWGNCSQKGHITLNQHLIKAPASCIDGVIMHELCHLKHFNHSAAFYALMDSAMSDWRAHRDALRALAPQILPR